MNVTLIYALLAYSSIKQRDFSGFYVRTNHLRVYFDIDENFHFVGSLPRWCSRDLGQFMYGLLSALSLPTPLPGVFPPKSYLQIMKTSAGLYLSF